MREEADTSVVEADVVGEVMVLVLSDMFSLLGLFELREGCEKVH